MVVYISVATISTLAIWLFSRKRVVYSKDRMIDLILTDSTKTFETVKHKELALLAIEGRNVSKKELASRKVELFEQYCRQGLEEGWLTKEENLE